MIINIVIFISLLNQLARDFNFYAESGVGLARHVINQIDHSGNNTVSE
jgi:hypothetical protein